LRADSDADGILRRDEILETANRLALDSVGKREQALLAEMELLDTDSNGLLDMAEFRALLASLRPG